jgi:hypothetical protein
MSEGGCAGCFESMRGIQQALRVAKEKAKQQAIEQQRPIAIVQENNEYVFYDPFYAYQNRIPVKEVVSHL